MFTFLKAQATSITATIVDFVVTIALVKIFGWWYVIGSAVGTVAGGITHFSISRHWVFEAGHGKISAQALKYFLVWCVYLLISTGLVFVLTNYADVHYVISKVIVACLMSVCYNYLMHKKFVFK